MHYGYATASGFNGGSSSQDSPFAVQVVRYTVAKGFAPNRSKRKKALARAEWLSLPELCIIVAWCLDFWGS